MSNTATGPEYFDVVIIGGGISGIGAAAYITREFPNKTVALLEGRDSVGGTWDLFKYPGIRSDSDLHTFAYEFKSWKDDNAIADAPLILDYLKETVDEYGLGDKIRYRHKVVSAAWSSDDAEWLLDVDVAEADGTVRREVIKAGWVFGATGYYNYEKGFTPEFAGREDFTGDIIHPQHWPEGYDYSGKKVVVIGSGATAITLIPSMLKGDGAAAHVTMLQRTPTYILTLPRVDALSLKLTRLLGERGGYLATRWKNILIDWTIVELLTRFPNASRRYIRSVNVKELPAGFDVDKHFTPSYSPWDQRVCLAPDGDFFEALRAGTASVATDHIERITRTGIQLKSGEHLPADIIVSATGLEMQFLSDLALRVDGEPVRPADTVTYKGMMISGVPNLALAIGYTNASWTLKCDLTSEYVCRLLNHMDAHGYSTACPELDPSEVDRVPFIDFTSGYVQRALDKLPKQGSKAPWKLYQNYVLDLLTLRHARLDDGAMRFSGRATKQRTRPALYLVGKRTAQST